MTSTDRDTASAAKGIIENRLFKTYQSSDYYMVMTSAEMMDAMDSMLNTLMMILILIAAISLLVGGIGIMNIMLVSVTERTREIGIRKSLGAKCRDIRSQFIIEAGTTSAPAEIYGTGLSMPKTAENVAERFHITREEQDAFSVESQRRAHQAIQAGYFKEEIVPVHVKEKKNEFIFDTDEFVKPTTTLEVLAKLRPIVKPDGTVTAGNSCGLNDGAAALVLMSETQVKAIGLKPMARIIDVTTAALDPTIMGYGPYYATNKILQRTGMTLDQIDLVELNEAFASQSVACIRDLGLDPAKVNINGGAIALGHPLGCTGARLIVTLMHNLKRTGGKIGLATLCIGGGQAMAALIEMQ